MCERNNFSTSVSNENLPHTEKHVCYLVRSSLSISLENTRSELQLRNHPSPEDSNVGRLFKMFSSHAVNDQLNLVTETVEQVGQPYVSHEVVLAVSQSSYVPEGTVPSLKKYYEQRNIILNISIA